MSFLNMFLIDDLCQGILIEEVLRNPKAIKPDFPELTGIGYFGNFEV